MWGEGPGHPTPGVGAGGGLRSERGHLTPVTSEHHQGNLECHRKTESSFEKSPNFKSPDLLWTSLSFVNCPFAQC